MGILSIWCSTISVLASDTESFSWLWGLMFSIGWAQTHRVIPHIFLWGEKKHKKTEEVLRNFQVAGIYESQAIEITSRSRWPFGVSFCVGLAQCVVTAGSVTLNGRCSIWWLFGPSFLEHKMLCFSRQNASPKQGARCRVHGRIMPGSAAHSSCDLIATYSPIAFCILRVAPRIGVDISCVQTIMLDRRGFACLFHDKTPQQVRFGKQTGGCTHFLPRNSWNFRPRLTCVQFVNHNSFHILKKNCFKVC